MHSPKKATILFDQKEDYPQIERKENTTTVKMTSLEGAKI